MIDTSNLQDGQKYDIVLRSLQQLEDDDTIMSRTTGSPKIFYHVNDDVLFYDNSHQAFYKGILFQRNENSEWFSTFIGNLRLCIVPIWVVDRIMNQSEESMYYV